MSQVTVSLTSELTNPQPVLASSIVVRLNEFSDTDTTGVPGSVTNDDDVTVFLFDGHGDSPHIFGPEVVDQVIEVISGELVELDFSKLDLTGVGPITEFDILATGLVDGTKLHGDHFFVTSVTYDPIPTPSAALLGFIGLGLVRHRAHRRALAA